MNRDRATFYLRIVITTTMLLVGSISLFNIFANFGEMWYWLVVAIMYTMTVNDIFCHRICSHRMFKVDTSSRVYKVLTWLASMDMGYGPVKWIVMSHDLHHIYSDNGPEDVMNWRHHWYSTTIVSPIPRQDVKPADYDVYLKKQQAKNIAFLSDPWTSFCCKYQAEISLASFAVLLAIVPVILFNVIFVGRVLLTIMTGLAGFVGHIKNFPGSYRNFNTKDTTSNNILLHYLFLGMFAGMLQNNHHGQPKSEKPNPKWWELDTTWPIVRVLRICMEKK